MDFYWSEAEIETQIYERNETKLTLLIGWRRVCVLSVSENTAEGGIQKIIARAAGYNLLANGKPGDFL